MDWSIGNFPLIVLHVFGTLFLLFGSVFFYLMLKRVGVFDRLAETTHRFFRLPRLTQVVVLCFVAGFIVYGSTKNGGGGGSTPSDRVPVPRRVLQLPPPTSVTQEDIVRGYRVSNQAGQGGPLRMPAGTVTNDLLRLRGGHDWAFRVEPDDWCFPIRGDFINGVTVFARGEVRPDVGTPHFPVLITNGVSLLPQARWNLLPHGGASVFRHAVTNGSLLLDWHNALVGRDPSFPTNLQLELRRDGGFVWRTDDGSCSYLPVFPFDWDGDGLENSVDPEPLDANPVAAHGTPVEWYTIVCSNVFWAIGDSGTQTVTLRTGEEVPFRTNVNANAYYFVDVVAARGPAPIYFNADRDSRLGSPVVVALAGETNRVPLLMGVVYSVTSTVPIAVTARDAMHATVIPDGERAARVKWPLDFEFVEAARGAYTVHVTPYDPGGEFTWNSPVPHGGGAMLMSVVPLASCGCWSGLGSSVSFNCSEVCTCSGGCQASGLFTYEDADFAVTGGVCNCGHYEPPHDGETPLPPSDPGVGGLSITFSERAVIFEDAYANAPHDVVQRRSTTTRLTISASGGPHGGSFTLSARNLDKLMPEGGTGPLAVTSGMTLSPGETYCATFVCSGARQSDFENDVRIDGEFTEKDTGNTQNPSATVTVVKVEVVPEVQFPADLPNRHTFGVCERVGFFSFPNDLSGVLWEGPDNVLDMGFSRNQQTYQYLLDERDVPLTFTYKSVSHTVATRCLIPSMIVCTGDPTVNFYTVPNGQAGGVGMNLALTLCPSNVSFSGIRIKEAVTSNGVPSGYFKDNYFSNWWNHTGVQGANRVISVGEVNNFGDSAEMVDGCPRIPETGSWSTGSITWTIPVVWREPTTFSISMGFQDLSVVQQKFTIDSAGTVGVEKFGKRVERAVGATPVLVEIQ